MGGMVGSVVVQETVNQVLSGVLHKYEEQSTAKERLERLEMAHIKLEAALETSHKWRITDASLLRWQKKLKRVSQECDNTLRECKRPVLQEQERTDQGLKSSYPFTKWIAHANRSIMSFTSLLFSHDHTDKSSASIVRRFEWFADNASEFLRFVEFGGTPRQYMFFDPLIRHLFAGRKLDHRIDRGNNNHFLFLIRPFSSTIEHGVEARLLLIHKDAGSVEGNFVLGVMLQLSESTDIVGTAVRCLQLFTADHFKSAVEAARGELTQLPTQDFHWVPYADSSSKQHWHKIHNLLTQWFRPNPVCCKLRNHQHDPGSSSSGENASKLHETSLGQVIQVYLQHHIVISDQYCSSNRAVMKHGVLFSPHCSPEDMQVQASGTKSFSPVHVINVEKLDKIRFPTAMDFLTRSAEATVHQMVWKSPHGAAYLQVGMAGTTRRRSSRGTSRNGKKVMQRRMEDPKRERTQVVANFLKAWLPHTPRRLHGTILDWIEEEKEMHLERLRDHPGYRCLKL